MRRSLRRTFFRPERPTLTSRSLQSITRPFQKRFREVFGNARILIFYLSIKAWEEKSLPKSHLGWFFLVFGEGKATKENISIFWFIWPLISEKCFSTGSCRYVYSSKSFLFALYNINGYAPVKVNIKSSRYSDAILTCSNHGPIFGAGGHDLYISNNAASNSYSYTYCGYRYLLPPGYSASGSSCRFYAGGSSRYFTPTDVEVFYETTT